MAVVSDWVQPDPYTVPLSFRTGMGVYQMEHAESVDNDSAAEYPSISEVEVDGVLVRAVVARWSNLLTFPPDSVFGADDASPTVNRIVSRYSHESWTGTDTSQTPPRGYSRFERKIDDRFLTMWIPSFPSPPVVPPEVVPEGATVEYESPAGTFVGDPEWSITWAGRNHNSGGAAMGTGVDDAEFFLHRLSSVSYPSSPASKPPLNVIAATQPIVDSLVDASDSNVAGDAAYDPLTYTTKTTVLTARPVVPGQFAVTVRPRLWTGPAEAPVAYEMVTSEPDGDWRGSQTTSYRTGRILAVSVTQLVQPPRYRFVWPGGQYRLRQRQSLPASDGWPLRQRQNGAHSGSWPLRQRQTGV